MSKVNTKKNTKEVKEEVNKAEVKISVVTAERNGKTAVQVRWLGNARPTDEDKAKMKSCGLRFYKDIDGACWASFKLRLEDVKALIVQLGYNLDEKPVKKSSKKPAKKETAPVSGLEKLASLDEATLAKLLKIAELLG